MIFTRRGIDISLYPTVEVHLSTYYQNLKPKQTGDECGRKPGLYQWYEIQDNVAYYKDFEKEKILWIELSDAPKFSFDDKGFFPEVTTFIMTGSNLKYLTAFLNSKACEWYFDKITTTSGVGTNRWKKVYIEQLAIPIPSKELEMKITLLVDEIIRHGVEHNLLKKVDKIIYSMLSLDEDEIKLIEKS